MQEVLKGRTFRCAAINPILATSARRPSGRRAVLLWVSSQTQSRAGAIRSMAQGRSPSAAKVGRNPRIVRTAEAVPLQKPCNHSYLPSLESDADFENRCRLVQVRIHHVGRELQLLV